MDQPTEKDGGLFASLRRLFDSALELVQNRFQVFTVELQEEKIRFFDLLLRVVVLAALGAMTLITATALVVVCFWDTSPIAVLAIVTLCTSGGGQSATVETAIAARPVAICRTGRLRSDRECLGKTKRIAPRKELLLIQADARS
jgi:uncharacterized membrane protein YqjE